MGRRCGTMRMGTRGGSRLLAGGTCLAVIVLCGTLQGDEVAWLCFQFLVFFFLPVVVQRQVPGSVSD